MRIVITGGAGFLGTLLTEHLIHEADGGRLSLSEIISFDLAESRVHDPRVRSVVGAITDPEALTQAMTPATDAIIHLAAVLSGGSEADFDAALEVNIDGTRMLLEAARRADQAAGAAAPRFIFTSSLAVFGGKLPELMPEHWATEPDSTYGVTKSIGELLVNEYSRKGFVDARICRLPTISVRPGKPNSAASSFASGIIREPLNGEASTVPVPHDTPMWLASPRVTVRNLAHALTLPAEKLGNWRVMNLPGISVTVGGMLDALERVGGPEARALVTDAPDPAVAAIVTSWPGNFDVARTEALGFERDSSFEDAVRQYHEDFVG